MLDLTDVSASVMSRSGTHPSSRTRTHPRSLASGTSEAPGATVANGRPSGAARSATLDVGERAESLSALAAVGATGGGVVATAFVTGGVVDSGGFRAAPRDATSPALDLRAAEGALDAGAGARFP